MEDSFKEEARARTSDNYALCLAGLKTLQVGRPASPIAAQETALDDARGHWLEVLDCNTTGLMNATAALIEIYDTNDAARSAYPDVEESMSQEGLAQFERMRVAHDDICKRFTPELLAALRALDLNVVRAKLCDETNRNTFYITNLADGEKVTKADKLEEIRMTILTNMMEFHPESKEKLILGVAHMPKASTVLESMEQNPLGPRPSSLIPTKISCKEHPSGSRTELTVETTDRPGLLTDIVKLLKDISVNVMSAEIDTVGLMAHDVLYVSYHGAALDDNMMELVRNVLQYYLSKAEVSKEESY
mgnify:CR=1 FL=1